MKVINKPLKEDWPWLISRPAVSTPDLEKTVMRIFSAVRKDGDKALFKYTRLFDKVQVATLKVSDEEIKKAGTLVPENLKRAIALAERNIRKFHAAQMDKTKTVETSKGIKCWRENRAIEKTGIYIPGGTAPLFSTVLMLGIPAMLAGCTDIVLCSPPGKDGHINPVVLYTAGLIGITTIYKVGGIQAIGALTFGTESVPKVNKLFGPGNQYVTAAKQMAQRFGMCIDLPAGPSEVLIIADKFCEPDFVAADLLSQAEHGPDSQVILLSNERQIISDVKAALKLQLKKLPREGIARAALMNSKGIVLKNLEECIDFSNLYAPEHLILAVNRPRRFVSKIVNAGSVFLGKYSSESAGDYASGTNHTLPTNGCARSYSGVSVDSFVKKITFQEITKQGILNIGPAIEQMAEAEQLMGHKNAISIRLKAIAHV